MKLFTIVLLMFLFLTGCNIQGKEEKLSKMKAPVIVKGIGGQNEIYVDFHLIAVDANGNAGSFSGPEYSSLKPGDTLK